jgi:hypothetical protein
LTETRAEEQIEIWKNELAIAMADEQWRLALQLCSWLRHSLGQQELSDPEVEQTQRQAKEGLAEQVIRDKGQQEREGGRRRLERQVMYHILAGEWDRSLDSIEALYQQGANRQEVIHLLQELKNRLPTMSVPAYRQRGHRVDELMERVGGAH